MNEEQSINILWSHGVLLDLGIGRSLFQKKLKEKDMLLDELNGDVFHLGHKKLIPKTVMSDIVLHESNARIYLKNHSIDFPISGARFVYYKSLSQTVQYLTECKAKWEVAVAKFIEGYDDVKEAQILLLNKEAERIMEKELSGYSGELLEKKKSELGQWLSSQEFENRSMFPSKDKLQSMFRFGWTLFKINALDGVSALSAMEEDAVLEAQAKLKEEMKVWVKQSMTAIHKSLGEAAAHTKAILEKNGKLQPKNLKPLFEAFEVFRSLDFTGNSDFQMILKDVEDKFFVKKGSNVEFDSSADSINSSDESIAELKGLLGTISSLAIEETAELAGVEAINKVGEFKRLIEV